MSEIIDYTSIDVKNTEEKKAHKEIARLLMTDFISNTINDFQSLFVTNTQFTKQEGYKHLYSIHFEKIEIKTNFMQKSLDLYFGFGINLDMTRFVLGHWRKEETEHQYHFWLRVCKELQESGIESIEINNFDEYFWLNQAMNKTFYDCTQDLS